ncbi:MAG: YtxH domain-containing protein [Nitrospirae bacterium]|nr:MAG: YtxH domain-containing protein [Nitrospirota bacterium]
MTTNGRQAAKIAALIAGGAAVGAGLALLYAPQSGTETRRQLRHYAKKTQVQATRIGRDLKDGVERAIERGKALVAKKDTPRVVEAA